MSDTKLVGQDPTKPASPNNPPVAATTAPDGTRLNPDGTKQETYQVVDPTAPDVESDVDKVKVTLVKNCLYTDVRGIVHDLKAGIHMLMQEDADHWWIRAHSDNPPPKILVPGTPEYVDNQRLQTSQRVLREAALDREAQEAALDARNKVMQKARPDKPVVPLTGKELEDQTQAAQKAKDEADTKAADEYQASQMAADKATAKAAAKK